MTIETDDEINELIKRAIIGGDIEAQKGGVPGEADGTPKRGSGPPGWYKGPGGGRDYFGRPWNPPGRTDQTPEKLYVYYVKFNSDGGLHTTLSISDVPQSTTPAKIDDDVKAAIIASRTANPSNIENAEWERPSYVAFFLDNKAWELIDIKGENLEKLIKSDFDIAALSGGTPSFSLHFLEGGGPGNSSKKNNTFFLAQNRNLNLAVSTLSNPTPESENVRYLLWVNRHYKAGPGNSKPRKKNDEEDTYKFDVFYRVAIPGSSTDKLTMIIDPSSRNTGPKPPT